MKRGTRRLRYLAIGHVCRDVVPGGTVVGGTAAYAALTARTLGWQAAVLTRAHRDPPLPPDVECVRLPDAVTTTFENVESHDGRHQRLHAAAGPIRASDLPERLRAAEVVHLAPIVGEVDSALARGFGGALVGVTPQGWLRRWDATGRVSPRRWPDPEPVLRFAGAVVLSIDDVAGDWREVERLATIVPVLAVTQGAGGCTVLVRGTPARIPAPKTTVADATGAGDVFAAGFFARLYAWGDPLRAARFATCIAARSVTRRGLAGVPTAREVRSCTARASG